MRASVSLGGKSDLTIIHFIKKLMKALQTICFLLIMTHVVYFTEATVSYRIVKPHYLALLVVMVSHNITRRYPGRLRGFMQPVMQISQYNHAE